MAAHAQAARPDTLLLTLAQAEQRLQQVALPLLVQRYEIDAARAVQVQAGLLPNPVLSVEHNIYNPESRRAFDFGNSGQSIVNVQQLVQLAGKRNKAMQLAAAQTRFTEQQYFDMVRTLLFELRRQYAINQYFDLAKQVYDDEVPQLTRLVKVTNAQAQKGNIALTDVVRLQALLVNLEREELDIQLNHLEAQKVLRLLTGTPATTVIKTTPLTREGVNIDTVSAAHLLELARANRTDLKVAQAEISMRQSNLALQRSQGKPDLNLGYVFDRRGSAWDNYSGLQLSVPLPVFDRNQGNIKLAEAQLQQSRSRADLAMATLEAEVIQALEEARLTTQLLRNTQTGLNQAFGELQIAAITNFQRGNISLLQFIDMFEAYTESRIRLLELRNNQSLSFAKLNFVTGTNVYLNY